MQFCSVEKCRPGTTAESLRGGVAGCSVEEHRSAKIRGGVQAGTGDPTVINNSPMVSYRNADLELSKTGFRGDDDSKSSCNMELQSSEKRAKV